MSHWAATVCIHPLTLLTNRALHIAVREREWSGPTRTPCRPLPVGLGRRDIATTFRS